MLAVACSGAITIFQAKDLQMKQNQFEQLVDETLVKCHDVLVKNADHDQEDCFAHFKRSANLTGCIPLQVALLAASEHYDAIATRVRDAARGDIDDGAASIESQLDELINACLLMKGLAMEPKDKDDSGRERTRANEQRLAARASAIQRQAEVVASPAEPALRAER